MKRSTKALAAGAALLAGCATTVNEAPPPAAQGMSPAEIVAARQSAFHLSGAAMGNMHAAIERGGDISGQTYAARGVARWAKSLPTMFPASTAGVGPTRAKPEIWTNRADFDAKAAAYAAAADALAAAAQAKDAAAFKARWEETAATCGACHDLYQVPRD